MRLETRFGVIEVDEKDIIHFPAGIPGFPDVKKYILLEHNEQRVFHILQGVDDPAVAFVLVDPRTFVSDYTVEVPRDEVEELQLESEDETTLFAIVTVPPGNPRGMTANLQAPVVVNSRARIGRQLILVDSSYSIRHPLLAEAMRDGESMSPTREAG